MQCVYLILMPWTLIQILLSFTSGIALLYFHLHHTLNPEGGKHYLLKAEALLERPLRHLKRRKFTFLCGDGGPLAVAAVVFTKLGKVEESEECVRRSVKLICTLVTFTCIVLLHDVRFGLYHTHH